jgi:iron complex outermembrane receptor protein
MRHSTNLSTLLLLGVAGLAILPAQAQAEEDKTAAGEIVVTAQRREQSVKDIPFTVKAVGQEALANASVNDVFALQSQVPGLDIRSVNPPSAGGAFSIRGLGTGVFNLGFEPSVGTFIDGIYRARSGVVAQSDFLDLEQVEVLKGPQGTLFGKNTTAGLINFVTAKPKLGRTEGMVRAEYGNYNRINLQGMVNLPLGDKAALRVSGGFVDDNGFIKDAVTKVGYAEKHRWNIRGQLYFKPSEDFDVRIIADYAKANENTQMPIFSRVDQVDAPGNVTLARAAGSDYFSTPSDTLLRAALNRPSLLDAKDYGVSAEINYSLGDVTLTSLTSYRKFEDLADNDNDFTGVDTLNTIQGESIKTFTQELRLAAKLNENIDVIVGGFYGNEKIRRLNQFIWGSQVATTFVGAVFGNKPGVAFTDNMGQDADSYGIFAHTIAKFGAVTFTGGLRYSADHKDGFGTFSAPQSFPLPVVNPYGPGTPTPAKVRDSGISGTASLSYAVSENANFYGTYSRGYKAGGISLIRDAAGPALTFAFGPIPAGCVGVGGPLISCTPNAPTFQKETVDHFEAGMKGEFADRRVRLNLALFHTKVQNLQTQSLLPSGTFNVVNIGSATSKGVDVDVTLRPTDGLELSGGVVYAKVKDNLGKDLDHAPRWSGGMGATYNWSIGSGGLNAFVHGDLSFKSNYFTTNTLAYNQEAYSIGNARIGIRGNDDRWEVSAWCRNCFNKRYRTVDFTIPLDGGGVNFDGASVLSFVGEPRFFGGTIQYKF